MILELKLWVEALFNEELARHERLGTEITDVEVQESAVFIGVDGKPLEGRLRAGGGEDEGESMDLGDSVDWTWVGEFEDCILLADVLVDAPLCH